MSDVDYSGGYDGGYGALSDVSYGDQVSALQKVLSKLGSTWIGRLAQSPLAPGRAATGQYETQPATPGIWTDEDEARAQLNNRAMYDQAGDLANLAVGGGLPKVALEGVGGASKSTFGSIAGAGHNGGPPMGGNPGGFYSAVGRAVENAPKSTRTAEEWGGWLRNQPGIKADELTSLGLNPDAINPGLRGQKLDKDTLLGHVQENTPKFNETVLGDTPAISVDHLREHAPNSFAALRAHGLEPEIGPDGDMVGFHHADSGDLLMWDDIAGDESFPKQVQNAAEKLDDVFHELRRGGEGRAQYADYTGIPDQGSGNPDPAYRERTMQLQREPRDDVEPDDLAVRKYKKSWDDTVAKVQAARATMDKARLDNTPNYASAVEEHRQAKALLDQVHGRMIDDTWQRKPYWQNQGMQHGADEIAQRAQELESSAGDHPMLKREEGFWGNEARRQMHPQPNAPYNFEAPHFNNQNEDLLFHVRDTDGHVGGADIPSIENRLVDATHSYVFDDTKFMNEIAQMRYENTVEPNPATGDVTYWQELPEDLKQKWFDAAKADLYDDLMDNLGSGAPAAAVHKGLITPEEAADISRHKGWQNEYLDKPGVQTTKTHHVEEFQSDWLQKARDKGYQLPEGPGAEGYNAQIPDAPFKSKWQELAMKKAVLDAVAKGKDAVSWWPGEVHGQRYGFERHVDELRYDPSAQKLTAFPKGRGARSYTVKPEDLADYVGKEHAEKLTAPVIEPNLQGVSNEYSNYLTDQRLPRMSVDELLAEDGISLDLQPHQRNSLQTIKDMFQREMDRNPYNSLRGDQLRVITKEGQGQRGFYNDIMPRTANSLFKKYGAKVERGTVSTHHGTGPAHILKITPKLREAVQNEGLPLFQAGVPLPHIMNDGRDDDGK